MTIETRLAEIRARVEAAREHPVAHAIVAEVAAPALLAAVETVRETCTLAIEEFEDPAYEANGYALGIVASSRTILHYLTAALEVQA